MTWRIHHRAETESTNLDARAGAPGDVFTADCQTAGRGRLDHKWLSPPGENLLLSAVLPVGGLQPDQVATLPLVAGLAVAQALQSLAFRCSTSDLRPPTFGLKWPNDVLVGGRKIAGILCERHGDSVIVGIGVNVLETEFPSEIAGRATSLALVAPALVSRLPSSVSAVRDAVLAELGRLFGIWREKSFAALHAEVAARDVLKGRSLAVRQTDGDAEPVRGVCGGIQPDGSLLVGETRVYAGEAHVIP